MADLPTGTVTFLATDIEGSTALLQRLGDHRYARVLEEYRQVLSPTYEETSGQVIDAHGDAVLIAFHRARDGVTTAVAAQRAISAHPWPDNAAIRVRMALHTGEPIHAAGGYVGLDVHRAARICSLAHGGQVLLSQTTGNLVERDLPPKVSLRELGAHRLKDLLRPEKIFQVVHPDLPADFPPLKSLETLPNNLPVQLTSFIGLEGEIDEVKQLLATTRLLTMTGAGGCGKTRLALQVAAVVLEDFAEGVWLVELATLSDPTLLFQAVASALNIREQPGRSLQATIIDYLSPKQLLLVLDNCEHLVAACARLAETLLRACPHLRILATSREALGIAGETIRPVPSLSVPDPRRQPTVETLRRSEATRLFIERAIAGLPTFSPTTRNAEPITQVCQRLDGIPLAIELAAARVKVLSVEQIASRLDDRFRLLTGGSRTGLPRHQTLRATMDWSYELLSEAERVLLRRLAVFAGGFTLETAEAVCTGMDAETSAVLDLLTHLVDKSLVIMEERGGTSRYRLLDTVRQYGRNKLLESGEDPRVRRRHRDWYLQLAEAAEPELHGPDQRLWLDRMEMEHDNLRTALDWSKVDEDGSEAGLRLAGALWWFWYVR
jgi:predicted ATPase/class 3 adenylate cyclase